MEIRRFYNRLISTMGSPILVRWHLYIDSGPRVSPGLKPVRGDKLHTSKPYWLIKLHDWLIGFYEYIILRKDIKAISRHCRIMGAFFTTWKQFFFLQSGIILWMRSTNERRCYIVTLSLIGWTHMQNDPFTMMVLEGDPWIKLMPSDVDILTLPVLKLENYRQTMSILWPLISCGLHY